MKMLRETRAGLNLISQYSAEAIHINGESHACTVAVTPSVCVDAWAPNDFAALDASHLAALLVHKPALIILGTGSCQHFPPATVLRPLIEAGVGFEVMDTGAACRTYNILASEGRNVLVALLLPSRA